MIVDDSQCYPMIVGGQPSVQVLTIIIDYHAPLDQGLRNLNLSMVPSFATANKFHTSQGGLRK